MMCVSRPVVARKLEPVIWGGRSRVVKEEGSENVRQLKMWLHEHGKANRRLAYTLIIFSMHIADFDFWFTY